MFSDERSLRGGTLSVTNQLHVFVILSKREAVHTSSVPCTLQLLGSLGDCPGLG
jgi:hypothetical protein